MFGGLCGYDRSDLDVFRRFPQYKGLGRAGFITDFLGVRTSSRFVSGIAHLDGSVSGYPVPADFHATALEYIGTLKAVVDAHERKRLVVIELGAGWGPWLITAGAAAEKLGIKDITLIGVEADRAHLEMLRRHAEENGFAERVEAIFGAVTAEDGVARFPVVADPSSVWGSTVDDPTASEMIEVPAFSIAGIISKHELVDLLHIDIQGSEAVAISSSRDAIKSHVQRMVIGTHSRKIEVELVDMLTADGWRIEHEQPCLFGYKDPRPVLQIDGCQVWRNPTL